MKLKDLLFATVALIAIIPALDCLRSEASIELTASFLGRRRTIGATVHDFGRKVCDGP
jgi:hypothetical protein